MQENKICHEEKICPVVLPEGKFGDEFTCCEYCTYADDYKDGFLIFSDKVKCSLDGKWHDAKHVCKNFVEL